MSSLTTDEAKGDAVTSLVKRHHFYRDFRVKGRYATEPYLAVARVDESAELRRDVDEDAVVGVVRDHAADNASGWKAFRRITPKTVDLDQLFRCQWIANRGRRSHGRPLSVVGTKRDHCAGVTNGGMQAASAS